MASRQALEERSAITLGLGLIGIEDCFSNPCFSDAPPFDLKFGMFIIADHGVSPASRLQAEFRRNYLAVRIACLPLLIMRTTRRAIFGEKQ
jgi:hypothetical protein